MPTTQLPTEGVTSTGELTAAGLSRSTIAHRCRANGPWRRLFPSVILLADNEPTRAQLLRASLHRYGRQAVLTGVDALAAHGVDVHPEGPVHLLVPANKRVAGTEHTTVERSSRVPEPVRIDGLPYAPPARAAIDAARGTDSTDRASAYCRLVVADGLCDTRHLWEELDAGNQRGTAVVRDALASLRADDEHTAPHRLARRLLRHSALPRPTWHATVRDTHGHGIGTVDAWWDALAVGWRFSPELTSPGDATQLRLIAAGAVLVDTPAGRLNADPTGELARLAHGIRVAARRPRPPGITTRR